MTERAEQAYRLDSDNYDALAAMAAARSYGKAPLEGAGFARRMIELNRHGAFGYHWLGHNLGFAGQRDEAIPQSKSNGCDLRVCVGRSNCLGCIFEARRRQRLRHARNPKTQNIHGERFANDAGRRNQ